MKRALSLLALSLLSACSIPLAPFGIPATTNSQATDAAAFGGLSADIAAHPSTQLAAPRAFALTPEAQPFLQALDRTVAPLRQQLALELLADPQVSNGLAQWDLATSDERLSVLGRVATLTGDVMGCQVPPIKSVRGQSQSGMLAFFQPDESGPGQIVLYPDAMAKGGKYLAVATLVHEIRHAAQYQLLQAHGTTGDEATLVNAYAAAWQTMANLGGQADLPYGDYTHLNMEFDAFQTGNAVAAILSRGTFNPMGYGFVDTYYKAEGTPILNLLELGVQVSGLDLIASVNKAQYDLERTYGRNVQRPRHQGFVLPRGRLRRG